MHVLCRKGDDAAKLPLIRTLDGRAHDLKLYGNALRKKEEKSAAAAIAIAGLALVFAGVRLARLL